MGASQEVLFARTLEAVKKQAKEQQNCISEQQVREAFAPLQLSEEQFELVFDYFKKHKIGIDEPVDLDEYLSEEEINYLEEYKKELSMIEEVSEGKKEAIILSAMAGERDAQDELIRLYLPQVVEISKLYSGQGIFLEDLIGEGNVALSMGVSMLGCLEHAKEAEGMLMKMIMDAMENCINENMQESDKDQKVLVSEGKKEAIILSAMAGERDAQDELIRLYLPQVVEISKLYSGQGIFLEDLIGEGNVALSMGVSMLGCLEHAKEAEGMLMKMIMDAMENCINENMQESDKDQKVLECVNKVADKARELALELHRKVTAEELAEETGMSEKTIRDAMRMSGFAIEDLEG